MTETVDFSACERLPGCAYNGASGTEIAYADFVEQNRDGALSPLLARILPRIDFAAINALIDDAQLLTDLQRQFYKTYLAARYEVLFK